MDAMPALWVETDLKQLAWDVGTLVVFWYGWLRPIWRNRKSPKVYDLMGFNEPTRAERRAADEFVMEGFRRELEARRAAGVDPRTLKVRKRK